MSDQQLQLSREDLFVPDRFEGLREVGTGALRTIIVPVDSALKSIDERFVEMRTAHRGALMLLRGETGAGKSTFLDTIGLFRKGVVTERIPATTDVAAALVELAASTSPRIVVLEGREALGVDSRAALEAAMHGINAFVRSDVGRDTLVVWPTNTDDLTSLLVDLASALGGEALFGVGVPVEQFGGPSKTAFVGIAERTVAALNQSASLFALGISEEQAARMAEEAPTIGRYLAMVRRALVENGARVRALLQAEQFRLWTVVIAGNDPEGDVAALTRGGYALADIDRLMTSTGANIVKELKEHPDQLGILASVLDARILHVDMMTALAVARRYGDEHLHELMKTAGMSIKPDAAATDRLRSSELGLIFSGQSLGTRKRGGKPGGGTKTAFGGLANIARTNDGACNQAFGAGLVDISLIEAFETEKPLGTELSFTSDLYCVGPSDPVRIEIMWRSTTSRADIANYVLGKLGNYGRAIGLLGETTEVG
jgi:DNA (cytosine-5)-methyltransferase 1